MRGFNTRRCEKSVARAAGKSRKVTACRYQEFCTDSQGQSDQWVGRCRNQVQIFVASATSAPTRLSGGARCRPLSAVLSHLLPGTRRWISTISCVERRWAPENLKFAPEGQSLWRNTPDGKMVPACAARIRIRGAALSRRKGPIHALSLLRQSRHPGEGFAADRRFVLDPPPPRLPGLRRALHHFRARAIARADRGQEIRPPRALRSRQAGALGAGRPAQAPGRSRSASTA